MNAILKCAILGLALSAANASAQEPSLAEANIVKPEHPTRDNKLNIGFVYNGADGTPQLKVAPAGVRVSALSNGETLALDDNVITLKPDCPGSPAYPLTVTPDGRCKISATLHDVQAPGLYTAKVLLVGKGGGQQEVKLDFARRAAIGWAIGLVFLGIFIGLIVTAWRGGGRDRTRAAIAIKEAIEQLELLDKDGAGRPPRMGSVIARALEIEAAVLRASSYDPAEVLEVQRRVPEYRFIRDIEAQASNLSPDKQRELAVTIGAALKAMYPLPAGALAAVPPAILAAVRDKLEELKARPDALADDAGQPIPGDLIPLPITLRMSSASARLAYAIAEWGVAFILMLVFAATALGTLYYGKTYWGSYGDMLAAFMVGFGACAGAVASVDAFLQRARNVPTFP